MTKSVLVKGEDRIGKMLNRNWTVDCNKNNKEGNLKGTFLPPYIHTYPGPYSVLTLSVKSISFIRLLLQSFTKLSFSRCGDGVLICPFYRRRPKRLRRTHKTSETRDYRQTYVLVLKGTLNDNYEKPL